MADYSNNYELFKKDFEIVTGLKVKDNQGLYIQYYTARVADINMQASMKILLELQNKK